MPPQDAEDRGGRRNLLSLINQGSVIFGGDATAATWVRVGLNYVVPFCVSSLGFLSATRRRSPSREP
jgi:hypothetical protein